MLKLSQNSGFNTKKASAALRSSAFLSGDASGNITLPGTIVAGDLIVVFDSANNTSGLPTLVVPAGYSTAVNITGAVTRRLLITYKIATSQDAGATYTGMNGTQNNYKSVAVFSGQYSYAQSYSAVGEITDNNPAAYTIAAASGKTDLFALAFFRNAGGTGNSFTPTQDGIIDAGTQTAYYKVFRNSPQDILLDSPDGGSSNVIGGCYISTI